MIARKHGTSLIGASSTKLVMTLGTKLGTMLALAFLLSACSKMPSRLESELKPKSAAAKPEPTKPSTIAVDVNDGGPIVLTTSKARFEVLPDGYVKATLLKDGQKLSLDDPRVGTPADSDFVQIVGKNGAAKNEDLHFTLDFQQAQVHEAIGKMGAGKRIEIPARPLGPSGRELQRVLA